MAATDFIVAIELGSSKVTGIAGIKNSDGGMQVLALVQENSSVFIKKGIIYNLDKTAQCLTSIINKLEAALDATIGKVYVGIGGQSLRTVANTVIRHLDEEVTISQELVDEIKRENIQIPIVDMEILEVAPQEYRIGNNLQTDPVGVMSNQVEGRFLNIVARTAVKRNIVKCFEQAKIDIAGFFISPLTTAEVTLSDSEKRSGCALVDFGADTTTVSIYQKGILRHLSVIPLGGNSITHDICSQQLEEDEAEELKKKYATICAEADEETEENNFYPVDDKRNIHAKILNDIVEARTEEIVANVWNQIVQSGYDDKLLAGIIITGGASNLKGLDEAIRKRIKQEKGKIDKVRQAKHVHYSVKGTVSEATVRDASLNTILGLLYAGEENCCKPQETPMTESEEWKNLTPGNLFVDEDEDEEFRRERKEQERERDRAVKERKEQERKLKEQKEKERKEKEKKEKGPSKFGKWINDVTNTIFSDEEMK